MSVRKIKIDVTGTSYNDAGAAYHTELANILSSYGFTVTAVSAGLFYVTMTTPGLDTLYLTFYNGNNGVSNFGNYSRYVYPRKSAPTLSSYSSQFSGVSTTSIGMVNITSYTNEESQTTYQAMGYVYIIQNSNDDIYFSLSQYDYGAVRLPLVWFGIMSATSSRGSVAMYLYYSGNSYSYFLTPMNGGNGYFSLSTSAAGEIPIDTDTILMTQMGFAVSSSNMIYDGGLIGYTNYLYLVNYTSITLQPQQIYVIGGSQYLKLGIGLMLRI